MSFSQKQEKPWFYFEKKDSLPDRIKAVQKLDDPTTYTDEVLRYANALIVLMLIGCGVLSAMSYYTNYAISFPIELAVFLAVVLTVVVEFGKNKALTWAVRIPFFQGWGYVGRTPANTFVWLGLAFVAGTTFYMSVFNSTKGAEQLAVMFFEERNSGAFVPDTKEIDKQIKEQSAAISAAPMVKWKGKLYYQDAKTVRSQNATLESLVTQRKEAVSAQLSDHKVKQQNLASRNKFASKMVAASGGWLEFIYFLLILIKVACEKNLDQRMSSNPASSVAPNRSTPSAAPIGFNLDEDGNVRPRGEHVTQLPSSVTQHQHIGGVTMSVEEALRWFETELRREPSNLTNRHANKETVIHRIKTKLDKAHGFIESVPDGTLPTDASERFGKYLSEKIIPIVPEKYSILELIKKKTA